MWRGLWAGSVSYKFFFPNPLINTDLNCLLKIDCGSRTHSDFLWIIWTTQRSLDKGSASKILRTQWHHTALQLLGGAPWFSPTCKCTDALNSLAGCPVQGEVLYFFLQSTIKSYEPCSDWVIRCSLDFSLLSVSLVLVKCFSIVISQFLNFGLYSLGNNFPHTQ